MMNLELPPSTGLRLTRGLIFLPSNSISKYLTKSSFGKKPLKSKQRLHQQLLEKITTRFWFECSKKGRELKGRKSKERKNEKKIGKENSKRAAAEATKQCIKRLLFDCDDNEESESDAEEIVDHESDADIENFEGKCGACLGTDGLDEANNWIGCNSCPRWFHKSCLSGGVEEMDEEEILRFHFKCPICEKSERSIKRRRVI